MDFIITQGIIQTISKKTTARIRQYKRAYKEKYKNTILNAQNEEKTH